MCTRGSAQHKAGRGAAALRAAALQGGGTGHSLALGTGAAAPRGQLARSPLSRGNPRRCRGEAARRVPARGSARWAAPRPPSRRQKPGPGNGPSALPGRSAPRRGADPSRAPSARRAPAGRGRPLRRRGERGVSSSRGPTGGGRGPGPGRSEGRGEEARRRGAAPRAATPTCLLVVIAHHDEVVGQPGHGCEGRASGLTTPAAAADPGRLSILRRAPAAEEAAPPQPCWRRGAPCACAPPSRCAVTPPGWAWAAGGTRYGPALPRAGRGAPAARLRAPAARAAASPRNEAPRARPSCPRRALSPRRGSSAPPGEAPDPGHEAAPRPPQPLAGRARGAAVPPSAAQNPADERSGSPPGASPALPLPRGPFLRGAAGGVVAPHLPRGDKPGGERCPGDAGSRFQVSCLRPARDARNMALPAGRRTAPAVRRGSRAVPAGRLSGSRGPGQDFGHGRPSL